MGGLGLLGLLPLFDGGLLHVVRLRTEVLKERIQNNAAFLTLLPSLSASSLIAIFIFIIFVVMVKHWV